MKRTILEQNQYGAQRAGFGSITIDDYDYDYMSFLFIDYDYDYDYSSL